MTVSGELYREVEQLVWPVLNSNARRFRRQLNMTMEEAIQEARYGLMLALRQYDYNESHGGIYSFAAKSVRRHFLKAWMAYRTQARHPHVVIVDEMGKRKAVLQNFVDHESIVADTFRVGGRNQVGSAQSRRGSFIDAIPGALGAPDADRVRRDSEETVRRLLEAIEASLSDKDRAVLQCKIDPPRGLQAIMFDECATEPTIPMICKHLGISKNAVDWAIRRIREATSTLIQRDFSEMRDLTVFQEQATRYL